MLRSMGLSFQCDLEEITAVSESTITGAGGSVELFIQRLIIIVVELWCHGSHCMCVCVCVCMCVWVCVCVYVCMGV